MSADRAGAVTGGLLGNVVPFPLTDVPEGALSDYNPRMQCAAWLPGLGEVDGR